MTPVSSPVSFFTSNKLRFVEFNVENLFLYLDHYNGQDISTLTENEWQRLTASVVGNKPIQHVRSLARAVLDIDPDILMLCEVGGVESLANFSRLFLNDAYAVHLIEGNSDRGIDLGYLVKKSLPFRYDLRSHKSRAIDFLYPHELQSQETGYGNLRSARLTSHKFSRDVLELRIFEEGDEPVCIVLLVHLKSQLDRTRIDPGGRDRRRAELEKLITIYNEINDEFEGRVPIMLTGDFNGKAAKPNPDEEFTGLYARSPLEDVLEVAGVANEERFTHMQLSVSRNRIGINKQLDYIFISPKLFPRVSKTESWVYRFKDHLGVTMLMPRNLNEKRMLASDHYPVILTLEPEAP
jgi:endonuclease/exonuclease/phosphatase family metal-dependent hydrolase